MRRTSSIAVVWQSSTAVDDLAAALADAWPGARICVYGDLLGEAVAVPQFAPQLVVVGVDILAAEAVGSLRLLCRLVPDATVLVVTAPAHADFGRVLARNLGARHMVWPTERADLARHVAAAGGGTFAPEPQALLNLTLGISDEVNNPLQSALGHLRLLEAELTADQAKLARVQAATRSLRRIQATLERTRHLQRAAELPAALLPVDVAELLRSLAPITSLPAARVHGDRELLATALHDLLAVGRDISEEAQPPRFDLVAAPSHVVVRLHVPRPRLAAWQLPRTFEPYYLSRLLRGTSHGLKLFGVHHIVVAHGGTARAHRDASGALVFELVLPAIEVSGRDAGSDEADLPPQ